MKRAGEGGNMKAKEIGNGEGDKGSGKEDLIHLVIIQPKA